MAKKKASKKVTKKTAKKAAKKSLGGRERSKAKPNPFLKSKADLDITWADTLLPAMEAVEQSVTTEITPFVSSALLSDADLQEIYNDVYPPISNPFFEPNLPPVQQIPEQFSGDVMGQDLNGNDVSFENIVAREVILAQDRPTGVKVPDSAPVEVYSFEKDVKITIDRVGRKIQELEEKELRQRSELHSLKLRVAQLEQPGFFTRIFNLLFK